MTAAWMVVSSGVAHPLGSAPWFEYERLLTTMAPTGGFGWAPAGVARVKTGITTARTPPTSETPMPARTARERSTRDIRKSPSFGSNRKSATPPMTHYGHNCTTPAQLSKQGPRHIPRNDDLGQLGLAGPVEGPRSWRLVYLWRLVVPRVWTSSDVGGSTIYGQVKGRFRTGEGSK